MSDIYKNPFGHQLETTWPYYIYNLTQVKPYSSYCHKKVKFCHIRQVEHFTDSMLSEFGRFSLN